MSVNNKKKLITTLSNHVICMEIGVVHRIIYIFMMLLLLLTVVIDLKLWNFRCFLLLFLPFYSAATVLLLLLPLRTIKEFYLWEFHFPHQNLKATVVNFNTFWTTEKKLIMLSIRYREKVIHKKHFYTMVYIHFYMLESWIINDSIYIDGFSY